MGIGRLDLDESTLESGELVSTALYWQPLRTDVVPNPDWVQSGTLWRQDVRLVDLVPDAGFEWDAEGINAWHLPPDVAQVVETERAGRTTGRGSKFRLAQRAVVQLQRRQFCRLERHVGI